MTARYYLPMYKFCTRLGMDLNSSDCYIHFDNRQYTLETKLLRELTQHNYTTICVSDDVNVEVMELFNEKGCFLVNRGDSCYSFDCGAKVEWLDSATRPLEIEEPAPKAQPEGWDGVLCNGNYDLTVKNGIIVDCKKVRHIPAGQYLNAAVCVDNNGCITELAVGNPLRTAKTCYDCGK